MSIHLLIFMFIAATAAVMGFERVAFKMGLKDVPNDRSAHVRPTPRGGGLVVVLLWLASISYLTIARGWDPLTFLPLVIGGLIVAAAGFLDDLYGLSPVLRLLLHILASCICVWALHRDALTNLGGFLDTPVSLVFMIGLQVLSIAWAINLFNFMDGTDGIAATEGILVFVMGGAFLSLSAKPELALTAWLLASALAGFLVRNWPPAKVFMGDVCSGFLGYAIAAIALIGEKNSGPPAILWWMLLSFFFFDASITLCRRFLRGEKWYAAHKIHAYQRLHHVAGWSHMRLLTAALCANGIVVIISWCAFSGTLSFWIAGATIAAFWFGIYLMVERIAPLKKAA